MSVDQTSIATQINASLATVQAALATVDIDTATPFQLAPVQKAVAAEIATLQAAIAQFDADIVTTSVAGMVAGNPAPALWPILLNQVSDSQQIAILLNALGYLQRLAINLSQATG